MLSLETLVCRFIDVAGKGWLLKWKAILIMNEDFKNYIIN